MINHYRINLPAFSRGYHIITDRILREISLPENGILHVFIRHTSAGLTINENADSDVRVDFESIFNRLVPENLPFLTHTMEGSDDMPAHIKATLVGSSVSIPIVDGRLDLGTWQGIYLCEFRNHGGSRKLTVTIYQ
jgi:secondary thiamine-phosphate synthase enzyme